MGLSIADIDKWNPESLSAVGAAGASRAGAASAASSSLGGLSAFESWQGQGAAAAEQKTQVHANGLAQHGQGASAVATAANRAANEVRQIKSQLTDLRSTLGQYGITVDAKGSRIVPPTNLSSLPAQTRKMVQDLSKTGQQALDRIRQAADSADDLLANALKPKDDKKDGPKVKVAQGEKKFEKDKAKASKKFGSDKEDEDKKKAGGKGADGGKDGKKDGKKTPEVTVAEKKAETPKVSAFSKDAKGEHDFGHGVKTDGEASVDVASAQAGADAKVTSNGVSAGANANATLAGADAKGHVDAGPVSADGSAHAGVQADAEAKGSIGKDGVNAGAGAFAGAKASADGSVEAGGVGAGGHAEVQAGIGANADVNAGMKDGKFKVGGSLGACLGVGGKVSFNVEVDPSKVTNTVKDVAGKVGKWFSDW
jgi:hypothetical protein